MIAKTTELIPHRRATQLAECYQKETTRIRELIVELGECCERLREGFAFERTPTGAFSLSLDQISTRRSLNESGADEVLREFKRDAWRVLVDKLGIRKVMSTSRSREMSETLSYGAGGGRYGRNPSDKIDELPEITPESILGVLGGFTASAEEYLAESIREIFDWLQPRMSGYKTNQRGKVGRKVIRPYVVEKFLVSWRVQYGQSRDYLLALDNIFHLLDGKGIVEGHVGPLIAAIEQCDQSGYGQTEYFKFRCCKNGNLHLEFLRPDLLAEFNRIAGEDHAIASERRTA